MHRFAPYRAIACATVVIAGLAACAGPSAFEISCQSKGLSPGSAAFEQCLKSEYAQSERLANRYASGGP